VGTTPPSVGHHGRVEPRRIGLLGGECTGKTTLAEDLARTLPGFVAEEYLRDFVSTFGRLPAAADQEGIYLTQQMTVRTVERAAGYSETPWVIADPLPLMTAVYSVVYFNDHSLIDAGIADASSYDVLLWCAPDIAWVAEAGMRDGIDFRDRADQVIGEYVAPRLQLTVISGDRESRLATALPLCGA
jgi:nicotinamide riboside kinase